MTMDTLTKQLHASIAYERRNNLTNLLNHSEKDLCVVIDSIEYKMREHENEIKIKERFLENAEDLNEKVKANLVESIAWLKNEIQSLIAWRAIFFAAIKEVK